MVVELSSVQVEDVKNPNSGPSTASTTNSTFNYGRDILLGEESAFLLHHRQTASVNRIHDGDTITAEISDGNRIQVSFVGNQDPVMIYDNVSCLQCPLPHIQPEF